VLADLNEIRGLTLRVEGRLEEAAEAHLEAFGLPRSRNARSETGWSPPAADPIATMAARSAAMLGDVFMARGQLGPAIEMYERASSTLPDPDTLEALAEARSLQGDSEGAARSLEAARRARMEADERLLANGAALRQFVPPGPRADAFLRLLDDPCGRLLSEASARIEARELLAADEVLRNALTAARGEHGVFHPHWRLLAAHLVSVRRRRGCLAEADPWMARLRLIRLRPGSAR
jgi:tetratricopeptide (TPR) repeat protein